MINIPICIVKSTSSVELLAFSTGADAIVEARSPGDGLGVREVSELEKPIAGVDDHEDAPDRSASDHSRVAKDERGSEWDPRDYQPHERVRDGAGPAALVPGEVLLAHGIARGYGVDSQSFCPSTMGPARCRDADRGHCIQNLYFETESTVAG